MSLSIDEQYQLWWIADRMLGAVEEVRDKLHESGQFAEARKIDAIVHLDRANIEAFRDRVLVESVEPGRIKEAERRRKAAQQYADELEIGMLEIMGHSIRWRPRGWLDRVSAGSPRAKRISRYAADVTSRANKTYGEALGRIEGWQGDRYSC